MYSRLPCTWSRQALCIGAIALLLGLASSVMAQTTPAPAPQVAAPAGAQPKLETDTTVWDFGEKWSGEPAETTLTLRNTGSAPLHVDKIKTSCGCTAAKMDTQVLQPGQSEQVRVTYNTKKQTENVSQTIHVFSDDPDNSDLTVSVRGHVKPLVKIGTSQGLDFGSLGKSDAVTQSVDVECLYTEPLGLKLQPAQPDFCDVQFTEVEHGKKYRLTATTKPPLRNGRLVASLFLETNLTWMPKIPVRILGMVQEPVAVMPAMLYTTPETKASHRMLRLTSRREKPVNIVKVSASDPSITVQVRPHDPERQPPRPSSDEAILIDVALPDGSQLPASGATITITTDDPEFSQLTVPVQLRMMRGPSISRNPTAKPVITPATPGQVVKPGDARMPAGSKKP